MFRRGRDLDEVFRILCAAIQRLGQRFPNAQLLADYTGGTKTMTAGLVSAALESRAAPHEHSIMVFLTNLLPCVIPRALILPAFLVTGS